MYRRFLVHAIHTAAFTDILNFGWLYIFQPQVLLSWFEVSVWFYIIFRLCFHFLRVEYIKVLNTKCTITVYRCGYLVCAAPLAVLNGLF